jgi:tetratricopeptide (TPR) repeat protein
MHSYTIGKFYLEPRYLRGKGGLKGAQSRFKEVIDKYPDFSLRDEVLFSLAFTYQQEEEPDEAAKYYQEILRNYPNSDRADGAREQLSIIGAPIPEPDPARKDLPKPEKPGFMGNLMTEVSGRADVTVGKDGILIRRDSKEGEDLIDLALQNNGQLPSNVTPATPKQRGTHKQPATTPANNEQAAPDKKSVGQSKPNPTSPQLGAKP